MGKGRLLVCSMDLERDLNHRPAARQLLQSLYAYMSSQAFPSRVYTGAGRAGKVVPLGVEQIDEARRE